MVEIGHYAILVVDAHRAIVYDCAPSIPSEMIVAMAADMLPSNARDILHSSLANPGIDTAMAVVGILRIFLSSTL